MAVGPDNRAARGNTGQDWAAQRQLALVPERAGRRPVRDQTAVVPSRTPPALPRGASGGDIVPMWPTPRGHRPDADPGVHQYRVAATIVGHRARPQRVCSTTLRRERARATPTRPHLRRGGETMAQRGLPHATHSPRHPTARAASTEARTCAGAPRGGRPRRQAGHRHQERSSTRSEPRRG